MKACILANTILLKMMDNDKVVRPIRMQKLLYYFVGFYSREISTEEFEGFIEEDFEAWKYGPVIPKLYYQLRHYRRRPISRLIEEDDRTLYLKTNDIIAAQTLTKVGQLCYIYKCNVEIPIS